MQFHYLTIMELADLLRGKEVSPVEVTEAMLARIEALDGNLNSYATIMAEQALSEAGTAEAEIAAGRYRGPLHGIPIAVKDLCYTKGIRTMGGAAVLKDHIPDHDATVVTKLRQAGAVLLGKLNLTEGAMGGYNPAFSVPINPWAAGHWAGASSSGSGVATAAGLCFASLGSDTGGSIRFPAACNGVVGLKPTYGRVSRYGVLPLAETLDHIGPLARCSRDAAIMMQAIAGEDAADPTSLTAPVPDMLKGVESGIAGLRIGFDRSYASEGVEGSTFTAVANALQLFEKMGAQIVDVEMPRADPIAWRSMAGAEAALAHSEWFPARADEYGPFFRQVLENGHKVTGLDYAEGLQKRERYSSQLRRVFDEVDVIGCPTMSDTAHVAPPEKMYGSLEEVMSLSQRNIFLFTAGFDFSGSPTISLPCGFSPDGLPYSIQFAGKHLSEPLLCRIGHCYERETEWHQRHPL